MKNKHKNIESGIMNSHNHYIIGSLVANVVQCTSSHLHGDILLFADIAVNICEK